jgi:hypothetical protein
LKAVIFPPLGFYYDQTISAAKYGQELEMPYLQRLVVINRNLVPFSDSCRRLCAPPPFYF